MTSKWIAATFYAVLRDPRFSLPTACVDLVERRNERLLACENLKHSADLLRFGLVHLELAATNLDVVAEHGEASRPFALPPRGADLVTRTFADDLALKLSKREKDIERQPAKRSIRVELLGDRHESDTVLIKKSDDAGKVEKR